jgi:hypothetical protein
MNNILEVVSGSDLTFTKNVDCLACIVNCPDGCPDAFNGHACHIANKGREIEASWQNEKRPCSTALSCYNQKEFLTFFMKQVDSIAWNVITKTERPNPVISVTFSSLTSISSCSSSLSLSSLSLSSSLFSSYSSSSLSSSSSSSSSSSLAAATTAGTSSSKQSTLLLSSLSLSSLLSS